ncbi:MAG: ABC transporter ATP-binding protein [Cyanobacteria bacterium J06649_4]
MSLPEPVLSCRAITKRFGAAAPAVSEASFELAEGELLGLLGPSGCGKTTLLRLVAGFEQTNAGEILLADRVVCSGKTHVPPEHRRVGVVFQDYALFPHLNVVENVAFGLKQLCRRGQLPKKQIQVLALEAINLVGLSGMEKRFPHELSGGQQQRVALARALAPRPPLILLDEPFSNLDVQVRLYLRQEVRDILKSIGASGIFVTHDQEEALAIADKVAVMQAGKIVQLDSPEGIYQRPTSRFVAEFVTQANFLAGKRYGDVWETEIGPAAIWPGADKTDAYDLREGTLMVCQEDISLEQDDGGNLTVQGRQFLGREYQYALLTPSSQTIWARTGVHQRLSVGARISAKIDCEKTRVFCEDVVVEQKQKRAVTV